MVKENAILNEIEEYGYDSFDFDELEEVLQSQLESELSELDFLENEKETIGNPDKLGKVILDEVWNQFGNQVGLDITNETLIQKYDREHPEQYEDIKDLVMRDKQYKNTNKAMKENHKNGNLKDEYTGKNINLGEKPNLDHVVSRKEIFENQRRKQANLEVKELANKSENLKPTNESLNKSKGAKSIDEYTDSERRAKREKDLIKQNERANKKVDESNASDTEKYLKKEKNDKRLQNKLDADDKLMKKADKEARRAINKDIQNGAIKEIGKKVGKDALKTMATSALFSMLKEIINGLIRFFKSKAKSFSLFLSEMKEAIRSFFSKITSVIHTGDSTLVGTIVSEIFGPIVSVFKKLSSLIKQGVSSIIDAVKYIRNKENKNKPFSVKVAQVGKIITTGIVAGGAIFLGELFEKVLLTVPGMQIVLSLIGTLANVIGLFLGSLISGLIGAIVINLIDKFISKRKKAEISSEQVDKGNKVLDTQREIRHLNEEKLKCIKGQVESSIKQRHEQAANYMKESMHKIFDDETVQSNNQEDFDEMKLLLEELLD